jgi:hypothetical protein
LFREHSFKFSIGIHGGLEGYPIVIVDLGIGVAKPESETIINIPGVECETGFVGRNDLQLPDAAIEGVCVYTHPCGVVMAVLVVWSQ